MGMDLYRQSNHVKELFEEASTLTHMDLYKILTEGTEEELKSTQIAQVVITLVNLSIAEALRERGILPDGVAGFSLGEYSALVAAKAVSFESALKLVQKRGELMGTYGEGEMSAFPMAIDRAESPYVEGA